MKTLFLTLVLSLVLMVSMQAQTTNPPEEKFQEREIWVDYSIDTVKFTNLYTSAIGVAYSNISGYGLSISKRFLNDYSLCLAGMITHDEKMAWSDMTKKVITNDSKNILYDIGVELQRDIVVTNKTKIYALIGTYYSSDVDENMYNSSTENIFALGVGCGFQWFWAKHVAVHFQFGYKFHSADKVFDKAPSEERKTTIGFGFGINYLF